MDDRVFESERATGHRNRAIAQLLRSTEAIGGDPGDVVDLYFRQCSVAVTARDLATIAATLANGGRNPQTGVQVIGAATTRAVLSVMATCGMYDGAGEWMFAVGLPAKSGVAGGLIAVLPGRLGIGIYSPPLDAHGNSVRAVEVCRDLSAELGLHLVNGRAEATPIRTRYTLGEIGSKRRRAPAERKAIAERGVGSHVFELQGPLAILPMERIASAIGTTDPVRHVVLDLRRVTTLDPSALPILGHLVVELRDAGVDVLVSAPRHLEPEIAAIQASLAGIRTAAVDVFAELDLAVEHLEEVLLAEREGPSIGSGVARPPQGPNGSVIDGRDDTAPKIDSVLFDGLDDVRLGRLRGALVDRRYAAGERLVAAGDPATELFIVSSGRLSVSIETASGDRRRLSTLGPGMMFGEGALVGSGRRSADVHADDAVDCRVITVDAFETIVADDPMIGAVVLRNLARIVGETAQRLTRELAILAG
jgi:glutaminase